MLDRVPEDSKCFEEVYSALWFDVIDRERGVSSDLLDRLRTRISILRDDKEPRLRRSIDDRDSDIGVLLAHKSEILSEPLFLTIEAVGRIKIYELDPEIFCKPEDHIDEFLIHLPLWCSDTRDMYATLANEPIDILGIIGIITIDIHDEIDPIIS